MATRASLEQISMTPLNCPPCKTYYLAKDLRLYISFITKVAASFV